MKLTRQLIEACQSSTQGYRKMTTEAFGVPWPLQQGWVDRLIGREISDDDYQRALDGRFSVKRKNGSIRDLNAPKLPQDLL